LKAACSLATGIDKSFAGQSFTEQDEKPHCPVCDYEFVVFFFVAKKKLPQIEHPSVPLVFGLLSLHPLCFSGSNRSLRAPPVA
jgi:hypothetical protein